MRSDFSLNRAWVNIKMSGYYKYCSFKLITMQGHQKNTINYKRHEEVLYYLQPVIPPTKRFDIFSPDCWGMLRMSKCVQIFL